MKRITVTGYITLATILLAAVAIGITLTDAIASDATHSPSTTVEIWFPDAYANTWPGFGNDTKLRVAVLVGSEEKAVTIVCPADFEPDLSQIYLASERRLETSDGRLAPPVWTLLADLNGRASLPRR